MSINNIISSTDPDIQVPDSYGFLETKFKDVTIDGNIYVKQDEFNRVNYTLQCYEDNRARFLPQPVLNELQHDVFGVYQPVDEEEESDGYFMFEDQLVDTNFFLNGGDESEIICNNDGLYWVTHKVTKESGMYVLNIEMEVDNVLIQYAFSSTPYAPGSLNNNTNFSSILYRFTAGQVIKLFRNYYPLDTPLLLADDIDGENVSTITFIKINV